MALQISWPHDPHLEDHVISVDVGQPELAVSAAASWAAHVLLAPVDLAILEVMIFAWCWWLGWWRLLRHFSSFFFAILWVPGWGSLARLQTLDWLSLTLRWPCLLVWPPRLSRRTRQTQAPGSSSCCPSMINVIVTNKDDRSSLQSTLSKKQTKMHSFRQFFNHISLQMGRKCVSIFDEECVLD